MKQKIDMIMKGFVEIKEDSYEDTIEHLQRLKKIACKLIKKLSEQSEIYDMDREEDMARGRMRRGSRYEYDY